VASQGCAWRNAGKIAEVAISAPAIAPESAPEAVPEAAKVPDERDAAAALLQARVRGKRARAKMVAEHKAASLVQAGVRGRLARDRVRNQFGLDTIAEIPEAIAEEDEESGWGDEEETKEEVVGPREGTKTRRRRVALDAVPHASTSSLPMPPSFRDSSASSRDSSSSRDDSDEEDRPSRYAPALAMTLEEESERESTTVDSRLPPPAALGSASTKSSHMLVLDQSAEEGRRLRAAAKIQACIRGRKARKELMKAMSEEEKVLRQQVMSGIAGLPDASIKRVQGMLDWALSAAPALNMSVRAQQLQLRKRAEAAGKKPKRPPDLSSRAHAWVNRQVNLGLLSGNGATAARLLVLAVRQVKRDGFALPSPSKRAKRQPVAGGGALRAAGLEQTANQAMAGFNQVTGGAFRHMFGGASTSGPQALSQADALALCEKLLNELYTVGMLHETNEWLQQELSWRGPASSAPAARSPSAKSGQSKATTTSGKSGQSKAPSPASKAPAPSTAASAATKRGAPSQKAPSGSTRSPGGGSQIPASATDPSEDPSLRV